ncbi:MAG: response regulator [Lachnospiraceae bacterium]|nr:response regulator [Lachnospiraceae bacterium]
MSTHDILLAVQYITITVLFVEILIVFLRWKKPIHSYLFLTCISSFICNVGYLLQMKAETEDAYITALKLSYVGRIWMVFSFFLFTARLCRKKIPRGLVDFLVLIHVGIYAAVLCIGTNNWFYPEYSFVPDPVFPTFHHTNGYAHDLLIGMNFIFVIIGMTWIHLAFRRERNKVARSRLFMLILAFGVQIIAFLAHVSGFLSISRYYDLTMPGSLLGSIFTLVAILGFDLLGTREIARDFVIDRISEGIIAVDNDGRIQYYNEPVTRLYPEFKSFFSLHGGSENEEDNDEDKENGVILNGSNKRVHTPYDIISIISDAVKSGETLKIRDRIYTPEVNDLVYKGETYGKLYALEDDTEHYRYMEELREQREIADNANEAKSKFLANMSHEIRTPINAVLGMDEMILRESAEKPIRAYASDIMSAGRTLLSLINDILDLSKIEEGKMEIIPVQYDLASLINDLVNMIRDRAVKKGLEFKVSVDEHIPHILTGDEIRIRQCVMNLLTNAVKYTETGEVNFKVSFEKDDNGIINLGFTVEDTGIGMKDEDMENLFSPYKRIEEKRNRTIEGTGLGMSITRQLLDLMGTSLKVKSEYGKGSVFAFTVKQEVVKWEEIGDISDRINDMSDSHYEYHELFHAPDAKILVVDDTEMNITVMQSLLKKTRINIDTAMSGADALVLTGENHYDVLFIDHMMPDMDGIETLKNIRASGSNKDVPAVALTANAVSGAREMYLEAGFTDYLSKPVDGDKLEKLLSEMLPSEKLIAPSDDDMPSDKTDDNVMDDSSDDLIAFLQDVYDIDEQAGLKNCGNEDGYRSVITVFHQTAQAKADEIEDLLKNEDIETYTVKVHALKSSARIIGATALSELAKNLENAGKKSDMEFINTNTDKLLDMYRLLDSKLTFLDRKEEVLPAISEDSLIEAYQTMLEIAGSMDYGMMDDLLKDLHGYMLPDTDKDWILQIESMLTQLDWDGIIKIVSEARRK